MPYDSQRTHRQEQPMDKLEFFAENGYVVVRDAVSAREIAAVNDGIDADRAAHPAHWEPGPRPGHIAFGCDAPELMHRTDALDGLVYHPSVVPLARAILGRGAHLSGLSSMCREPCTASPPKDHNDGDPLCLTRVWHREDSGNIAGAAQNAFFIPARQVICYLDDVDARTHCFSIIPESAETKRQLPKARTGAAGWGALAQLRIDDPDNYLDPEQPVWIDAFGRELARHIGRVDIHAAAGAAVIFNNSSYHAGTVRQTTHRRRTVHVRYRQPEPVSSRHALKEPWQSVAEFTAALPDRPTIGTLE